jgi:hypothetical protein
VNAFADLKYAVTTKSSTTESANADASQNNALIHSDGVKTFATASVLHQLLAAMMAHSGPITFVNVFANNQQT